MRTNLYDMTPRGSVKLKLKPEGDDSGEMTKKVGVKFNTSTL